EEVRRLLIDWPALETPTHMLIAAPTNQSALRVRPHLALGCERQFRVAGHRRLAFTSMDEISPRGAPAASDASRVASSSTRPRTGSSPRDPERGQLRAGSGEQRDRRFEPTHGRRSFPFVY